MVGFRVDGTGRQDRPNDECNQHDVQAVFDEMVRWGGKESNGGQADGDRAPEERGDRERDEEVRPGPSTEERRDGHTEQAG
jgi:hypothetical protein